MFSGLIVASKCDPLAMIEKQAMSYKLYLMESFSIVIRNMGLTVDIFAGT